MNHSYQNHEPELLFPVLTLFSSTFGVKSFGLIINVIKVSSSSLVACCSVRFSQKKGRSNNFPLRKVSELNVFYCSSHIFSFLPLILFSLTFEVKSFEFIINITKVSSSLPPSLSLGGLFLLDFHPKRYFQSIFY